MMMIGSRFRFRGTNVAVNQGAWVPRRDDFNSMTRLRSDASAVSALYAQHKVCNSENGLRHRLAELRRNTRKHFMEIVVTMERDGLERRESGVFDGGSTTRSINRNILNMRDRLIERFRADTQRYSRAQANDMRPPSYIWNYRGSINNRFRMVGNNRVGYVHATEGQFLQAHQARISTRMFEPVRPMTSERHVGIEIECGVAVSRERLGYLLREFAGFVMIKGDGSVSVPQREPVELNICAPLSRYRTILYGVCKILNGPEVKAKVNKSCGLHVHLDIREFQNNYSALQDKYARLISVQGILYDMQPKSRQNNTYCVKSKSRSITRGASRYQGINAQSIWKYSTIETRLHAGTTDYNKIANWVELLSGVMYSTTTMPKRALSKVSSLFKYYNNIPTSLMEYVVARTRQFVNPDVEEAEVADVA